MKLSNKEIYRLAGQMTAACIIIRDVHQELTTDKTASVQVKDAVDKAFDAAVKTNIALRNICYEEKDDRRDSRECNSNKENSETTSRHTTRNTSKRKRSSRHIRTKSKKLTND